MVLATPAMAISRAIVAICEHHHPGRGNQLHDGLLHLTEAHHLDVGELVQSSFERGGVTVMLYFDPDGRDFVGARDLLPVS